MGAVEIDNNTEDYIKRYIMKIMKNFIVIMKPYYKQFSLNNNEIEFLLFLAHSPHNTAKELSRCKGWSKSLVSKMTDNLIKQHYISSRQSETDRRVIYLDLQPKGLEVIKKVDKTRMNVRNEIFKGIKKEDVNVIISVLENIYENSKGIIEKGVNN